MRRRCCCSHVGFPKFGPIAIMNRSQGLCALECVQHDAVGSVYTVLTYAVRVGDVSLIKLLIKHGEGIMQSLVFHPSAPPLTSISSLTVFAINNLPSLFFCSPRHQRSPRCLFPAIKPLFQHRLQPCSARPSISYFPYTNHCFRNCRFMGCSPFQRCCLRFACNSSSH